jgi:hypothetical protein
VPLRDADVGAPPPAPAGSHAILRLQRLVGNGVVAGLAAGAAAPVPGLQRMDRVGDAPRREAGPAWEAAAEADPRPAIDAKLRTFRGSTSAGPFARRSPAWRAADTAITAVYDAREMDLADYYGVLVHGLMKAEMAVAGAGDENDVRRRQRYGPWKAELLELLDAGRLQQHLRALADAPGAGGRPGAHGPRTVGADEERQPMGRLPSNEYAGINAALRDPGAAPAARRAALLDSALVLEQYRRTSYPFSRDLSLAGTGEAYVTRVASTLFDGSRPGEAPPEGTEMTDPGWSFFGTASDNVSGGHAMAYRIEARLTKAVDYANELYGPHERSTEYATPPGSRFRFEGRDGRTWRFRQV